MKFVGFYTNGNYRVALTNSGTKVRYNKEDKLVAAFPESIDLKITNCCDKGCVMCHENSRPDGEHAELIYNPLFESIQPYTELAIGGGNPLSHPDLTPFLQAMYDKKVLCNLTVNIDHMLQNYTVLHLMSETRFINGLGISLTRPITFEEAEIIKSFKNVVIHAVAGITQPIWLMPLKDSDVKLLILGYKKCGRGADYYVGKNAIVVNRRMFNMQVFIRRNQKRFPVMAFDNLAIEQLDVKSLVTEETWNKNYMGEDGEFTMFIDLVKNEYAVSSTSPRHPIFSDNVQDLFEQVKIESGHELYVG